jgi:hypothetical protein
VPFRAEPFFENRNSPKLWIWNFHAELFVQENGVSSDVEFEALFLMSG